MRIINFGLLFLLFLSAVSCNHKEKARGGETEIIESYVILVSFDAFRWDYTDLYHTPNFEALIESGVKAEKLIPSFPTKTFPNHYTLATGLYPDHHGIINNSFYANDLGKLYRIGDRDMVQNGDAYFGEPIWVTAEQQGIRTASFYWVGTEAPIMGIHPTYWKKYDESVSYEDRVDQVIDWLEEPMEKRPGLITLYFDEPDGVGHQYGPEHAETREVVTYLDSVLGYLRTEIAKLEYSERMNLIVVSDHGMGPISSDRYVNLNDHLKEGWTDHVIGGNPVYLIDPADGFGDSVCISLNRTEGVSAWQAEDMPPHLHYGTSPRFPGIVAVADSFWSIGTKPVSSGYAGGTHGYDNAFTDMHAIFMAEGPAFRNGYTRPPFSNVEVYGIVAHILGLSPASTDGMLENVQDIFAAE